MNLKKAFASLGILSYIAVTSVVGGLFLAPSPGEWGLGCFLGLFLGLFILPLLVLITVGAVTLLINFWRWLHDDDEEEIHW
jgi:hypothetical protein